MSDLWNSVSQDDELEAILNEVRGSAASEAEDTSVREWSEDDIDRLVAQANGEEYVPRESKADEIDEKLRQLFGDELDTELFSVQPINEDEAVSFEDEMTDIFSGAEVDGQQLLYEKEEPLDEFDPELFSLETVFMPDDIPVVENKYPPAPPKPEKTGPLPPNIVPDEKSEEEQKVIDYRKKFYEKLRPEDIEIPNYDDKDPEYPYDKSGIVVRKGEAAAEDNLEAMPTVMAAEDVEASINEAKTKIVPLPGAAPVELFPEPENVEGQIVLNDFVDNPDDVIPVKDSEQSIEESLWKRRKQKAKNFKLDEFDTGDFSEDLVNLVEDLPVEEEEKKTSQDTVSDYPGEYIDFAERNKVHTRLTEKVKTVTRNAIIMGGIDLFMIILSIIPSICEKMEIETEIFRTDSVVLSVVNALLIIAAVLFYGSKFFDICKETVSGKISTDSAIVLSVIVALIENTVSATFHAKVPVFGLVAVFALFLSKFTDVINARRVLDNFSVCTFSYEHNINTVHHLDNESEIFELGRGLLMGNAEILYSSKSKFPSDFMKNSDKNDENNKYVLYLIIGALVASVGAGIVAGFRSIDTTVNSVLYGFAVFAAAFCLSSPVFGKFIPAFITFVTNKRLNKEGTLITSIDAAEHIAASNAVVLDSADIFDRKGCTMHGMKDFKSMRIDVVLLYAAAMVIKSGGPLKECFEEVVDGRQDLLPPVKELVYEDKLGISARIYDQKVLLGNRNMLVHHNIKAPNLEFENKYIHDGRKVIYLACNEQLAAMFVVSYAVDENIKGYLKQLEANGIQILVRTNDVNVTEQLISSKFGLNPDNFKILSSVAGRLFKRRKDAVADSLPAELIHDGGSTSMLRAIASCCTMATKKKVGTFIQIGIMALGIILATLSGCSENGISSIITMLIMLLESAVVSGVLILDRK